MINERRMAVPVDWVALALVACAAIGCVAGLDPDELPADPIAITYWEPEPARRRAEIIEKREAAMAGPQGPTREGVARVKDIGLMLGGASDAVWNLDLKRFPGHLALFYPRTGAIEPIPEIPPGAIALAWSSDHRRLLYLSNHRDQIQLYEYDRTKREIRQLTSGRHQHVWGDYGIEAQLSVLEVGLDGKDVFARILVTDAQGANAKTIIDEGQLENMRLSPDGKVLVYVHRPEIDRPELVARDLATGEERALGPGHEPNFARQGDWIVYSARSREGWRLRRVRLDGSGRSSMGPGFRDEKMPAVSPDGRFVVYVGTSLGVDRLFVRRVDGSGDRILLDEGSSFAPVW